ncbi:MAG: hypothetical protein Q9188_003685, partial [Gyalolechia gomerana]
DLPPWPRQSPAIQPRLRYSRELPVIIRPQRFAEPARNINAGLIISWLPSLENADDELLVLRKTGRDDEAGGAAADN